MLCSFETHGMLQNGPRLELIWHMPRAESGAMCLLGQISSDRFAYIFISLYSGGCDRKEVPAGSKPVVHLEMIFFNFMICLEEMGSALDLFASCSSSKLTQNARRALQILELGVIEREPRIMSF